jgi:heme O synthase-like polyprenyltransferase
MSGGLGVILAFFAAYFEWVQRNGKVALWIAAAIAFFVASYRLWLKKHRELDAEKK